MNAWPYVIVLALLGGMLLLSMRNRRRQAAEEAERAQKIRFGTEVMTTSGLYGTVTARNDDDTVQLTIAPGIEVKWALAALREVSSLPEQFHPSRRGDGRSTEADADRYGSNEGEPGVEH